MYGRLKRSYRSFLFYISKLLYVTVILYFVHSFSFSPRGRFIFQTEISRKYIVLVWISLLFYFFSYLCRGDQSTVSCIASFDFNWSRFPKIRHPFALVFCCGLADIRRYVLLWPVELWQVPIMVQTLSRFCQASLATSNVEQSFWDSPNVLCK